MVATPYFTIYTALIIYEIEKIKSKRKNMLYIEMQIWSDSWTVFWEEFAALEITIRDKFQFFGKICTSELNNYGCDSDSKSGDQL